MTRAERKRYITWIWMLSGMASRTDITWETMAEMTDAEVQEQADAIKTMPKLLELLEFAEASTKGSA
jgi:hypothetical protein